jgi:hypothetical protein
MHWPEVLLAPIMSVRVTLGFIHNAFRPLVRPHTKDTAIFRQDQDCALSA